MSLSKSPAALCQGTRRGFSNTCTALAKTFALIILPSCPLLQTHCCIELKFKVFNDYIYVYKFMLSTSVNWLHSYSAPTHSRSSFALTRHFTQQFCSLKVLKLSCFIVFIHACLYVEKHTKTLFRNNRCEWIKADLSLGHKLHVCQSLHSELASLVNWCKLAK